MKIVWYLVKKFFQVFFLALLLFVLILVLTDLFMNLWNYVYREVPIKTIGKILLLYVPKAAWYSIPMAMLFSTAYTLSDLYAKNELLAVFASGISLFKFTLPLLAISVFMSFGLFFFEDNLVVQTYSQKTKLQQQVLQKEKSENNDRIVIMCEGGKIIYKADFFDSKLKRLTQPYVIFRDENKKLLCIIKADTALYQDNKWNLTNAFQWTPEGDAFRVDKPEIQFLSRITESPDTFKNNTVSIEEVNTKDAREYIAHLKRSGLPYAESQSIYYKKYSFPFVCFIVVFLAVGLSGKTRKNVLLISLASSIAAVVVFYVLQMVTMLMAKFEAIGPFMGAWFPVIFFIVISIILLRHART